MATQIITCPSCHSRYKTAAEAGKQLKCPQCDTTIVAPAQPAVPDDPLGELDSFDISAAVPGHVREQPVLRTSKRAGQRRLRQEANASLDPELKPFLKWLGLGVGTACLLIVAGGAIGWFSEPIGMIAVVIGIVAMIGLAFAGRIWFIVIAFQESVGLGIAVIVVVHGIFVCQRVSTGVFPDFPHARFIVTL